MSSPRDGAPQWQDAHTDRHFAHGEPGLTSALPGVNTVQLCGSSVDVMGTVDAELLSAVVEAAPTPLWVIEADGTVALANQAAVNVLDYASVADVIGAPSHDTLHRWRLDGSRYASHACPIVDHRGARAGSHPEWFFTRVGRPIPVTWSIRPLGRGGAKLLSFTDASEQMAVHRREFARAPSRAELRSRLLAHVSVRFRDPEFTPAVLAGESHLSLRLVQQVLSEDGRSPATEIRRKRLELACALLQSGSTVQQACRASGFSEPGTFTRAFRRQFDMSPSEWLRKDSNQPESAEIASG